MRLWILSDLHQEFADTPWQPNQIADHDILIAAGDIHQSPAQSIAYLNSLTRRPIIYVLGNHEFYGKEWTKTLNLCRDATAKTDNIHFLENDVAIINGVRFLGCSLWTDFNVLGSAAFDKHVVERGMADFNQIRLASGGYLTTDKWLDRHYESVAWLRSMLSIPFSGPTVVVTHHAPHKKSIHPRYAGDALTAGFVNHLPDLLEKADIWVHGHVHDTFDYQVANCRVLCNPRGYPRENTGFDEKLVIKIG
ncbi:metallophosphoesterase [Brucellaceae bacterium D45D]